MRTFEEIQSDPSLNAYEKATQTETLQRQDTPPPPRQPTPSQATFLKNIETSLKAGLITLQSFEPKRVQMQECATKFQREIEALTSSVDIDDDAQVRDYVLAKAKLELAQTFLANSHSMNSAARANVLDQLRLLSDMLRQSDLINNVRPPEFTRGHVLEARCRFAIEFLGQLIP